MLKQHSKTVFKRLFYNTHFLILKQSLCVWFRFTTLNIYNTFEANSEQFRNKYQTKQKVTDNTITTTTTATTTSTTKLSLTKFMTIVKYNLRIRTLCSRRCAQHSFLTSEYRWTSSFREFSFFLSFYRFFLSFFDFYANWNIFIYTLQTMNLEFFNETTRCNDSANKSSK